MADAAPAAATASTAESGEWGGRITLFSLERCPHCKRAKALFEDKGWAYTNISVSAYPQMKAAMLKLSDRLTVPQIFFNEDHIGGASELLQLDETGELEARHDAIRGTPPPDNPLLQVPDTPPVEAKEKLPLQEAPICVGGECDTYAGILARLLGADAAEAEKKTERAKKGGEKDGKGGKILRWVGRVGGDDGIQSATAAAQFNAGQAAAAAGGAGGAGDTAEGGGGEGAGGEQKEGGSDGGGEMLRLDVRDRKVRLTTHRRCFLGSDLVDVLSSNFHLPGGRGEATQAATMLFEAQFFAHVTGDHAFEDSASRLYRFQHMVRVWDHCVFVSTFISLAPLASARFISYISYISHKPAQRTHNSHTSHCIRSPAFLHCIHRGFYSLHTIIHPYNHLPTDPHSHSTRISYTISYNHIQPHTTTSSKGRPTSAKHVARVERSCGGGRGGDGDAAEESARGHRRHAHGCRYGTCGLRCDGERRTVCRLRGGRV